jgi:acyl carrier protein
MSPPPPSDAPPQLSRFPVEVRDAYRRFRATGDSASVQVVVLGALREFLPKASPLPADAAPADGLRLIEDLGYDSLAVAEIVFFFEDLFQVTINNREITSVHTVGDLRHFVGSKLAEKKASA